MKFECSNTRLKALLTLLDRVTGKQLSLTTLSYIYCSTEKNIARLRATNLDIGVEVSFPVKTIQSGHCILPGQTIAQILSSIPFENISLDFHSSSVFLETPKHHLEFKIPPYEDFPSIPQINDSPSLVVSVKDFINGITTVLYSASITEIKPEISSVYCYTQNNTLIFVSTDGFRLAEKKINIKTPEDFKMIIPYKNAAEITRMLHEYQNEDLTITLSSSQCSLSTPSVYIHTRLIDGVYPDYPQLIPSTFLTTVRVRKDEFHNACKLTSVFCDKSNQLSLVVKPNDTLFELSAKNTPLGENTIQVDIEASGEDIDVFYNIRYVLDVFQSIDKTHLILGFNGKSKPLVIRPEGDNSFTYLIMPVNR